MILITMTLDDIYNERRFELAWECVTRQDMIRFGTFLKPSLWKENTSPEHTKLFPIPYDAYQTNNNIIQNPGYPAF